MAIIQRIKAEVIALDKVFSGVYKVVFRVPSRQNRFTPGQFAHLALDEFDQTLGFWPESRVFSISSEPKLDTLTLVYSVKGNFTRRMEAELAVGRSVWLKFPYGDFSIEYLAPAQSPLVIVAGGTGISPFIPFLSSAVRQNDSRKIHFHHGLKKNGMLIFEPELRLSSKLPGFQGVLYVEDETPRQDLDGWQTEAGRISTVAVRKSCRDLGVDTCVFLSGPPAMIDFFKNDLLDVGFSSDKIFIDSWE